MVPSARDFFFFFARYICFVWELSVILSSFTKENFSERNIEGLHKDMFIGILINMTVNGKGTINQTKVLLNSLLFHLGTRFRGFEVCAKVAYSWQFCETGNHQVLLRVSLASISTV